MKRAGCPSIGLPQPRFTPLGYTLYSRTRRVHAPRPPQTRRAPPPPPRGGPGWHDACYRTGQHVFGAAVALPPAGACARWGVGLPMGCLFGSRAGATRRRKYDHCPALHRCPCARQRGRGAACSWPRATSHHRCPCAPVRPCPPPTCGDICQAPGAARWPPASPRRSTPSTTAMPRPCAAVPPPAPPRPAGRRLPRHPRGRSLAPVTQITASW